MNVELAPKVGAGVGGGLRTDSDPLGPVTDALARGVLPALFRESATANLDPSGSVADAGWDAACMRAPNDDVEVAGAFWVFS